MAEDTKDTLPSEELAIHRDETRLVTHSKIDQNLCGKLVSIDDGEAKVVFETSYEMVVDNYNMVHAGFVFSSAAFAAVAAMNDPNAVIVGANVKFLAPIEVGNEIIFTGKMLQRESKKREVVVIGTVLEIKVFEGMFYIVTFDKHILKLKLAIS